MLFTILSVEDNGSVLKYLLFLEQSVSLTRPNFADSSTFASRLDTKMVLLPSIPSVSVAASSSLSQFNKALTAS